MKFKNPIRRGRPVEPPAGASYAHEHVAADGTKVLVLRDARGHVLPGSRLHLLRDGESGVEPRKPASVARAALGLPSYATEWERRRKEGGR